MNPFKFANKGENWFCLKPENQVHFNLVYLQTFGLFQIFILHEDSIKTGVCKVVPPQQ